MPADTKLMSQMYLKIAGKNASTEMMADLKELVVDTSLHLPDMFTIYLADTILKWVDSPEWAIGKEVDIRGKKGAEAARPATSLITKGEITAIEPEMTEEGATNVIIRGYDKTHRLQRGKKTRTFIQCTDSDIVSKIASEAGLSAQTDSTSIVHEHVFQVCQTDIEFLKERARRIAYYLYFQDGKLCFCREPSATGARETLEYGKNLMNFRARFTAAD